jgi:sugar porter (SP) family MFS transporter
MAVGGRSRWAVLAGTAAAGCSAGLAVGLMIGNIASVLDSPDFEAQVLLAHGSSSWLSSLSVAKGALGGAMPAGAIAGATVGFWMIDAKGRISSLLCAALLLLIGNCVAAAAGLARASLALALVGFGRAVGGLGVGLASVAAPPYTSEVAPRQLRGALGASYQLAITTGIFLGSLCGLAAGDRNWALSLCIPVPAGMLLALVAMWLPESPRWMLLCASATPHDAECQHAAELAAATALRRLRTPDANVEAEIAEILASLAVGSQQTAAAAASDGTGGRIRWTWGASFAALICLLQTGGGIDIIVTYGPEIFVAAGMAEEDRLVAQLGFTAVMLLATAVAVHLVEHPRMGRRRLIVSGATGCALVITAFSLIGEVGSGGSASGAAALVLPLALAFSALYSISWGPLAFLLATEMVDTGLRARCMAVGVVANFFADLLVIAAWPLLSDAVGQSKAFGVFAVINWAALLLVYLVVEETAGKSLEALHGAGVAQPHAADDDTLGGAGREGETTRLLVRQAGTGVTRPLWQ